MHRKWVMYIFNQGFSAGCLNWFRDLTSPRGDGVIPSSVVGWPPGAAKARTRGIAIVWSSCGAKGCPAVCNKGWPSCNGHTLPSRVVIPWLPVRSIVGWPLWRVMGWAKGIPKGWPTFSEREWPTLTPNGWLGQTPDIENIGAPTGIIHGWARRGAWAVPKGWVTFAERWSGTFTIWPKGTPNAIGWTPGIWKVGAPAARLSKAVSQHSCLLLVSHQ